MVQRRKAEPKATGRSALFYIGLIGVVTEEVARIVLGIPPSIPMLALFGSLLTGASVATVASGLGIKIVRDSESDR